MKAGKLVKAALCLSAVAALQLVLATTAQAAVPAYNHCAVPLGVSHGQAAPVVGPNACT